MTRVLALVREHDDHANNERQLGRLGYGRTGTATLDEVKPDAE